ncbi:MAG: carbohydrate kinase [Brucellaceae bacterium]|nr:carbohydrate kinase [Brucellaceae bacterium]
MPPARLLAIGGAHIDRRGIMAAPFIAGASIPGAMHEEVGGGAFNACVNAVREGAAVTLVGLRGGDAAGEQVGAALARHAIADLSTTYLDRTTPSYTALVTRDGDVVAALADMTLYDFGFEKELRRAKLRKAVTQNDAVLIDANLPAAAAARAAGLANGKPLYAIAISPAKVVRLFGIEPVIDVLFMNRLEAHALTGVPADAKPAALVDALCASGLRGAVVTNGAGEVVAFRGDRAFTATPPRVQLVRDATGGGDALAGTAIAAMIAGAGFAGAVRRGLAASALTVTRTSATAPITPEGIDAMLGHVGAAEPIV